MELPDAQMILELPPELQELLNGAMEPLGPAKFFTDDDNTPMLPEPKVVTLRPNKPFVKHFMAGGYHPIRKKQVQYAVSVAFEYKQEDNAIYAAISCCSPNDKPDSRLGHARSTGRLKSARYRTMIQEGDTMEMHSAAWLAFVEFWRARVRELRGGGHHG